MVLQVREISCVIFYNRQKVASTRKVRHEELSAVGDVDLTCCQIQCASARPVQEAGNYDEIYRPQRHKTDINIILAVRSSVLGLSILQDSRFLPFSPLFKSFKMQTLRLEQ